MIIAGSADCQKLKDKAFGSHCCLWGIYTLFCLFLIDLALLTSDQGFQFSTDFLQGVYYE